MDSIIRSDNIVPIGIISLEYDKIKESAIDSGWLYIQNNQLFENPNATLKNTSYTYQNFSFTLLYNTLT